MGRSSYCARPSRMSSLVVFLKQILGLTTPKLAGMGRTTPMPLDAIVGLVDARFQDWCRSVHPHRGNGPQKRPQANRKGERNRAFSAVNLSLGRYRTPFRSENGDTYHVRRSVS